MIGFVHVLDKAKLNDWGDEELPGKIPGETGAIGIVYPFITNLRKHDPFHFVHAVVTAVIDNAHRNMKASGTQHGYLKVSCG
jgi:hypothetical protein